MVNSRSRRFSAAWTSSSSLFSKRTVAPPVQAPLLPKLRGHFAEFLNEGSLARLRILSLPTCVSLRYGHYLTTLLGTISWQHGISHFATFTAAPRHLSGLIMGGFAYPSPYGFDRALPITRLTYPPASPIGLALKECCVRRWYRNINLLSIPYGICPRVRPD